MKNEVKKFIAQEISSTYYDVLIDGFKEQKKNFKLTLVIIEFINKLKENKIDIDYRLDNVLSEKIIDLMFLEAKNYIGRRN